jgi:hypothetical protein
VRDLLDLVDAAADEREVAIGTDRAVQAGGRRWVPGEQFTHRRPRGAYAPGRGHGPGERREHAAQVVDVQPQVVREQYTCRRHRRRCPRPSRFGGRVRNGIEERPDGGHPRDAVGDGVVHLDEHADPFPRQPGEEPHLPQWPTAVQAAPPQALGRVQERGLVAGGR